MDAAGPNQTTPLTARELREHIEDAFISVSPTVVDLLDAAIRSHARPVVFAALNRLPPRRFESVADVLRELPDLPDGPVNP
ncbi:DUF2795 domain-containing protein [Amycolatopsis cihanbeyliensis]|uniref:Uncharacterized protein DUF2795 n=1 Tax=Amycolatopsis cihanbeyliensis TaxID=1128664 RepID=A0A542DF87_AMYCI|nr:DUF2795 domain-containing protein [Amycolatopsis cihanbeyliensis]TQJ01713.1 uncharacterized protein DUF2795 [Amycolatopsis cihanbeyliensis]